MNPWIDTIIVAALAAFGVGAGHMLSRRSGREWAFAYAGALFVVLLFLIAARFPKLAFHPLLGWTLMGRQRYWVGAFVLPVLLVTPLPRLPRPRDRSAVKLLAGLAVFAFAVWPCLSAALKNNELSRLVTRFDADGVCLQSTDYTCGPAAAVTALRRLGISAEEGELARLAFTSPASGTPPDVLAQVLRGRFGAQGVKAQLMSFRNLEECGAVLPVLLLVKHALLTDHWIVVVGTDPKGFLVADPLVGLSLQSHEELESRWRGVGIVVHRD